MITNCPAGPPATPHSAAAAAISAAVGSVSLSAWPAGGMPAPPATAGHSSVAYDLAQQLRAAGRASLTGGVSTNGSERALAAAPPPQLPLRHHVLLPPVSPVAVREPPATSPLLPLAPLAPQALPPYAAAFGERPLIAARGKNGGAAVSLLSLLAPNPSPSATSSSNGNGAGNGAGGLAIPEASAADGGGAAHPAHGAHAYPRPEDESDDGDGGEGEQERSPLAEGGHDMLPAVPPPPTLPDGGGSLVQVRNNH